MSSDTEKKERAEERKQEEKKDEERMKEAQNIIDYCLKTLDKPFEEDPEVSEKRKHDIKVKKERIESEYHKHVKAPPLFKPKVFNDSIHRTIELNAVEVAFIQTPEFFRLKGIKQCGGAAHVYPGAIHTRFEHSLGVCHLAGEFVKTLREKNERLFPHSKEEESADSTCIKKNEKVDISSMDEQCVRLAGLCYNLGYGPFSELFENVKEKILGSNSDKKLKRESHSSSYKYLEHEELSVLVFKWILVEHEDVLITFVQHKFTKDHVEMISNMMYPPANFKVPPRQEFLYEIVANRASGLDADTWDLYSRDCHHLGCNNEFDYGRTIKLSNIVSYEDKRHIGYREKEVHNLLRMLQSKTVLYEKAYKHQVVQGIEMMISDILFDIREKPIFSSGDSSNPSKQSLQDILRAAVLRSVDYRDLRGFLCLNDSILDIIQNESPHEKLNEFMFRNLYKCCEELIVSLTEYTEQKEEKFQQDHKKYTVERAKISHGSRLHENPEQHLFLYVQEEHLPQGHKLMDLRNQEKYDRILKTLNMYSEVKLRAYDKGSKSHNKDQSDPQDSFVLDETCFQYKGESSILSWEGHGIEIHCESNSLPSGVDVCFIKISLVTSTNGFILPSGFELVSEVYKIECRHKFEKMVTLKIRHGLGKGSHKNVYIASSCDQISPYKFHINKSGEFDSTFGVIKISSFSCFAAIRNMFSRKALYSIYLYANDLDQSRDPDKCCILIFATKKSRVMANHVKRLTVNMRENLSLYSTHPVEFDEDASEISLTTTDRDSHLAVHLSSNLSFKKDHIDRCEGEPIFCRLQLEAHDLSRVFEVKFAINGIKENGASFISFRERSRRTESIDSAHSNLLTPNDLSKVVSVCHSARAQWEYLGLQLQVSSDDLSAIEDEGKNLEEKLLRVLRFWLQSGGEEKTWKCLADALGSATVGRNDVKNKILQEYCSQ